MGELPTPAIGRMLNAVLVSSIDHGVTPPSTLAARNVATTGRAVEGLRRGGHPGVRSAPWRRHRVVHAVSRRRADADARRQEPQGSRGSDRRRVRRGQQEPPGFGHRFHTRDPRAARLFQMALELELEGEHVRLIRATERAIEAHASHFGRPLPVNVDGAIAAISADLGFAYELGNAIFLISRLPGLIAHAHEERTRAVADAADRSEGPRLRRRRSAPVAGGAQIGNRFQRRGRDCGGIRERLHKNATR